MRWKRLAAFLPALLLMVLIFYFSAQPAEESSVVSESLGTELLGTLSRLLGFGWGPQRIMGASEEAQHMIRKTAHFLEYMSLGASLYFGFMVNLPQEERGEADRQQSAIGWLFGKPAAKWSIPSLAASALFAVGDEIHQLFVPGRAGMVQDVLVDWLGTLVGVMLLALLCHRRMTR